MILCLTGRKCALSGQYPSIGCSFLAWNGDAEGVCCLVPAHAEQFASVRRGWADLEFGISGLCWLVFGHSLELWSVEMPLVQLEPATREHGNGVALHFSRLVPTAWSTGDQIVNIQASWNLCDVPWELLIPALSVPLEDTSHQEWRGGLEAKYHSAEP